jgi:beta-glucosidase
LNGASGTRTRCRSIRKIDFTLAAHNALPANQSIAWAGTLTAPESGKYRLHLQLLGCIGKLRIDDQMVDKNWFNWIHGEVTQAGQDNIFPTPDGLDNLRAAMELSAGPHRFYLEVAPDGSNNPGRGEGKLGNSATAGG